MFNLGNFKWFNWKDAKLKVIFFCFEGGDKGQGFYILFYKGRRSSLIKNKKIADFV